MPYITILHALHLKALS